MKLSIPSTTSLLTLLLLAAIAVPQTCHALVSVENVDKKRAAELGIDVRVTPSGKKSLLVEIEFEVAGDLHHFDNPEASSFIELVLGSYGDSDLSTNLKEDRSKKGRVKVRFTASRKQIHRINVRLVTYVVRSGIARNLPMKNFVDLETIDAPKAKPAGKKRGGLDASSSALDSGAAKSADSSSTEGPGDPAPSTKKPVPGRTGNDPIEE